MSQKDPFAALAAAQKRVQAAKEKAAKQAAAAAQAAAALARLQRRDRDRARAALGGAMMAALVDRSMKEPERPVEAHLASLLPRLSEVDRGRVLSHLRDEIAAARRRAASAARPAAFAPAAPAAQAPQAPAPSPGPVALVPRPSLARE